uniref:Uncharacterized protein n=1 Tax=Halimeda minima TaxID=170427 RepID=A0A386AZ06_9CHLO|nr:hypothetical protein [Halimeda minima]
MFCRFLYNAYMFLNLFFFILKRTRRIYYIIELLYKHVYLSLFYRFLPLLGLSILLFLSAWFKSIFKNIWVLKNVVFLANLVVLKRRPIKFKLQNTFSSSTDLLVYC